jgi:hypothetical protein
MRRLLALLITLSLLPAATALASGSKVIRDCTDDGVLEGHYSQRDLRDALASIPSDVDEYTNCRDVIRRAAFGGAGGGKGGGGGGGGGNAGGEFGGFRGSSGADPLQSASPNERAAVTQAAKDGGQAVQLTDEHGKPLGGALIRPSQVARRTGPGATDVPTPLLIAALLLSLGALAAAAPTLRQRVLPRRRP